MKYKINSIVQVVFRSFTLDCVCGFKDGRYLVNAVDYLENTLDQDKGTFTLSKEFFESESTYVLYTDVFV